MSAPAEDLSVACRRERLLYFVTGSAGWMYRLVVESLLGLWLEGSTLHLAPCMPQHWREFKIHYRYRETVYHITVSQTQAGEAGSLSVDGIEQPGNAIARIDDRREHRGEAGHGGG